MTAQYTPGPWIVAADNWGSPIIGTPGETHPLGFLIVEGIYGPPHTSEAAKATAGANARLIAAAPDLLAACRAMLAWSEDIRKYFGVDDMLGSEHDMARAAIEKAEGGKT
jgi:hypothetical protein